MASNIDSARNGKLVVPITPSPTRIRMEIDELLTDNAVMNIYLLALEAMQIEDPKRKGDTEDWWTYYSLSSIHGQPPENWNDVPNGTSNKTEGYCMHGSVLFPTWHRVYVYMFEQAVTKNVHDIATRYADDGKRFLYQSAASRFRLPFWDPLLPRNEINRSAEVYNGVYADAWGVPRILGVETVWVERPEGAGLEEIPNPLYRFKFPKEATIKEKGRELVEFSTKTSLKGHACTTRSPGPNGGPNVYGHDFEAKTGLNKKIQEQGGKLTTALWKLLGLYDKYHGRDEGSRTWESFASHTEYVKGTQKPVEIPNPSNPRVKKFKKNDTSISLESWHDSIHMLVGTGSEPYEGHMADTSVAAFDPIFWLHHCNIDRILALWQALYGEWAPTSGKENSSTPLYPFHKTESDFWTSGDVEIKDWTRLGFAIPGDKALNEEGVRKVEAYINEHYSWGAGNGPYPPPSVTDKWPKDFTHSWALNGPDAKNYEPGKVPRVQFEALSKSALVTRSLSMPTAADSAIQIHDEPKAVFIENTAKDSSINLLGATVNGRTTTWNASIRVLKFAFDGSFNIHLFIGPFDRSRPERYFTKKNEVGFTGVFASRHNSPCANCVQQREQGLIYEDAIPLTASLGAYLVSNTGSGPEKELRTLKSLEPEHVRPFLKKSLKWVVTNTASQLIENEQDIVGSKLEIVVSSREYNLPTPSSPLGLYHPSTDYPEITQGQLGGCKTAETVAA